MAEVLSISNILVFLFLSILNFRSLPPLYLFESFFPKYTNPANPVRNFCMQKLEAPPCVKVFYNDIHAGTEI